MRLGYLVPLAFTGALVLPFVYSCVSATCDDKGTCGAPSNNDGAPPDGAPTECDPTRTPDCVSETTGYFVNAASTSEGNGSKTSPFKTIAKAIEKAGGDHPNVFVCDGTYKENILITKPLNLVGGLSCDWAPSTTKAKIAPDAGAAIRVTRAAGLLVADFTIIGNADPQKPGDSAIGIFVSETNNVTIRRSDITATVGIDGGKRATTPNWSGPAATGVNSTSPLGGGPTPCVCLDGKTSSIGGGGGVVNGANPEAGVAVPAVGNPNDGLNANDNCVPGDAGAPGQKSASLGTAAVAFGFLDSSGWSLPSDGGVAGNGHPGQGGGGGGSRAIINAGGGGGGCGGCGGGGGNTGVNGGSSFALLSFNSSIVVEGGSLTSSSAGKGGPGGDAQDGQAGGIHGAGGCPGGEGGPGAGGNGGGGGAGGHSVAVGFVGTEPRISGAQLTPSAFGVGGAGGKGGGGTGLAGESGPKGPDGKSQSSLQL